MTGNQPNAPEPAPYIGPALVSIPAATLTGVAARPLRVEVHLADGGLPGFEAVGLPDHACREVRDRVRAALLTSGFPWPDGRITVNVAPAGMARMNSALDLAIAIGILATSGWIDPHALEARAFLGELGLDGSLRPVPGVLALADVLEPPEIIVAPLSVGEARLTGRNAVRTATNLAELVENLNSSAPWPSWPSDPLGDIVHHRADLGEVTGLRQGRYALEVAAAGGHHLLLVGSPGAGKALLARRLPGLLPAFTQDEALEVTRIHSAAGTAAPAGRIIDEAPFRAPAPDISIVALTGGATRAIAPGEVTLAHRGVLFLNDLPEFPRASLEAIRAVIDHGSVHITRAGATAVMPAEFLLVAGTWPCPCGTPTTAPDACLCTPSARQRFARRIPGPLLDRFDLRVDLDADLADNGGVPIPVPVGGESTGSVAARVAMARGRARDRGVRANADLTGEQLAELVPRSPEAHRRLDDAVRLGRLTGRGADAVLRVALTIADLRGDPLPLQAAHITAALALRASGTPS